MADVEACSPPADDPSGGCCKARTILHVVVVTILLSASLFPIYLFSDYKLHYHYLAMLVPELQAYAAVGCLYIYNSSGSHEKFISAGYIVLVLSAFLLSTIGISLSGYEGYIVATFTFMANMVVISTYCIWKLSFIMPMLTNMVAIPLRLKRIIATTLHAAIVTILLAVIVVFYAVLKDDDDNMDHACLVQLTAYNAVGCLYMFNSSRQKEKVISAGFLGLLLLVFLLSSLGNDPRIRDDCLFAANIMAISSYPLIQRWFDALDGDEVPVPDYLGAAFLVLLLLVFLLSWLGKDLRITLLFAANIVAISSYCLWKLYCIYPLLRRWFDALDGEEQEAEALLLLHHQTPFHIQEVLREFSSDEIQAMTQDFGSMIGRGGSAQVFRGNLDDGTPVAVKRINIHGGRTVGGEEDFQRELSIIANVHHRSLVPLLGYCLQHGGGGLYLVYPFFENGSLDRWIFHGSEEQRRLLTWHKRLGIAVDVARALTYLHNECHWRILHLDVKPGNILLDGDLRAHVSDFGISLSITQGVPSVVNTRGRGTLGYMAPEMLVNSVSDRSDVFSYGKMLLELIGGRPNFVAAVPSADDTSPSATPDLKRDYFPYIVRDMMTRCELMKAVDAAMAHDGVNEEEVKTLVEVALCCIQEEPDKRPRMQDVVDMLEGRVSVNLPPESHPPCAVIFLDSVSSLSG